MTAGTPGGDLDGLFARIAALASATIRPALFTVTRFDPATLEVERVHSSNPLAYPVGGRKRKRDTEFSRRVLLAGEALVCEGDEAIAAIFDDHATIASLGLHSSINAPVLASDGRCVGVLNFLMREDRVGDGALAAARDIAADPALLDSLAALSPIR